MRFFPVPNSKMHARPFGLRTRAISAKEAERGVMLRMPNAIVRPSIHASGRGRARASAPTERTKSLSFSESFFCPCTSMGGQKSIASTCAVGWRFRTANVTSNVPAARSRTRSSVSLQVSSELFAITDLRVRNFLTGCHSSVESVA